MRTWRRRTSFRSLRSDIGALEQRRERSAARAAHGCAIPQGAIPEIHDRLRLVRPNEQIIFVSPAPSATRRERYARRDRHQPQRVRRDRPARRRRSSERDSASDVETHRDQYQRSLVRRKRLAFEVRRKGRRCAVSLAPQIRDDELEEQIASYLKSTEEWEPADAMPAAERHFLQKKRRAALFAR